MKYIVSLAVIFVFIFLLKFPEVTGLHFTDGNNYIYLAQLVEHGKLLYRDIYLDNFPLMIYISVIYKWLTFGSMQLFNMTSTIEKAAISALIYYITYEKWKKHRTAFLVAVTYFLSYTVISSSFQMGFYTSNLFILIAYFLAQKKRLFWAGMFAAFAVLTKAYGLFPVLGLLVSICAVNGFKSYKFIVAGIVTGVLVMLPTLLWGFPQFIEQTFGFGLIRGAAESKLDFYLAFAEYDFLIFILCIWNFTLWKKNLFVAAGTAFLCVFFLFYRDIYYIYFSYFPLFAALGAGYLLETKMPYIKKQLPQAIYITLLVFQVFLSITTYMTRDRNGDLIPETDKLLAAIQKENPDSVYGYSYVTNGISYLTGIPPYKEMYDVTTTGFISAGIDRKKFTEELIKSKTIIIVDGINVDETIVSDESIMSTPVFEEHPNCKKVYKHTIKRVDNAVRYFTLVRCY